MNATSSLNLIASTAGSFGITILSVFGLVLGIAVGVFLIKWSWVHLIKNFDMSMNVGGFFPFRTPFKGYKRFHSEKWNMDHMA